MLCSKADHAAETRLPCATHQIHREQLQRLWEGSWAWLVWLGGLSASLWTKGSLVRFPVKAHASVANQVPSRGCMRGKHTWCFSPFFSPSLPLSLKINKNFLKKKKKRKSSIFFDAWEPRACACDSRAWTWRLFNNFPSISLNYIQLYDLWFIKNTFRFVI